MSRTWASRLSAVMPCIALEPTKARPAIRYTLSMLHLPLLRRGVPYRSLDVARAPHHATGQPFVEISQANVGLIRRDLLAQGEMRAALLAIPVETLIEMTRSAAPIF